MKCEICGKIFNKDDEREDNSKFESRYIDEYGNYATISDLTNDKLLCLDCAIDEYEKEDNE